MKFKILIVFFLVFKSLYAQEFTYKISKPYCVLNFMQTATGRPGTSSSLKKFIDEKTANDPEFKKLCDEFAPINLHYYIDRNEFPESRNQNRSMYNLVAMNAVNAENLEDFKIKCIGLLPLSVNQQLFDVLTKAEKIYDTIIWNNYAQKSKKQLKELSKFGPFNSDTFATFAKFYQSAFTKDIPFQVAIYPIPGKRGNTTATPHVNSLCVGVLTEEIDYASRNGVILHEMCHVLFNEQSAETQNKIDALFNQNSSPYAKIAYSFIDEALATALGNGWAYKNATGKTDETSWYNNPTIDGFAKALYPKIESYLAQKKSIDTDFIDFAVTQFAARFPNSIYDYDISLNEMVLYTDSEDTNAIRAELRKLFRISSFDVSSPILHPFSLESINDSKLTQLFVIDRNHQQTIDKLKEIFPELNNYTYKGQSQNLSFIDKKGRTVIVLALPNLEELPTQLQKMKDKPVFDSSTLIQK